MPRGSSAVCAAKCAHFDVSKAESMHYFELYRKAKVMLLLDGLKPAAKQALLSKLPEFKVKLLVN